MKSLQLVEGISSQRFTFYYRVHISSTLHKAHREQQEKQEPPALYLYAF